jgi:hypothetical protein
MNRTLASGAEGQGHQAAHKCIGLHVFRYLPSPLDRTEPIFRLVISANCTLAPITYSLPRIEPSRRRWSGSLAENAGDSRISLEAVPTAKSLSKRVRLQQRCNLADYSRARTYRAAERRGNHRRVEYRPSLYATRRAAPFGWDRQCRPGPL